MTRDEECELYWSSLNWSGRTKVLRKLELRTGMFNDAWKDLPRMVRQRITRQWDEEEAKAWKDVPSDLAQNHDHYLYGAKKRD